MSTATEEIVLSANPWELGLLKGGTDLPAKFGQAEARNAAALLVQLCPEGWAPVSLNRLLELQRANKHSAESEEILNLRTPGMFREGLRMLKARGLVVETLIEGVCYYIPTQRLIDAIDESYC